MSLRSVRLISRSRFSLGTATRWVSSVQTDQVLRVRLRQLHWLIRQYTRLLFVIRPTSRPGSCHKSSPRCTALLTLINKTDSSNQGTFLPYKAQEEVGSYYRSLSCDIGFARSLFIARTRLLAPHGTPSAVGKLCPQWGLIPPSQMTLPSQKYRVITNYVIT